MKAGLTIGEMARELRLNPRTIRYYEEVGLLPKPRRSESGYRLYSGEERERLRLVKKAKFLGLSLAEIKEIVEYALDGHCSALEHRLLSLVDAKLVETDQKMQELITLRENLWRYQRDLSERLAPQDQDEVRPAFPTPCHCISEEVDSFRK